MFKLNLDQSIVNHCRELALEISIPIKKLIQVHTTVAIERASLRLLDVNGAIEHGKQCLPMANLVVDQVKKQNKLDQGILYWFVNGLIQKKIPISTLAAEISKEKINLCQLPLADNSEIEQKTKTLCIEAKNRLTEMRNERDELRQKTKDSFKVHRPEGPLLYVIVATGNIYDDIIQAKAAAQAGADAIAVIRSTAQSLLDYVPHGATTQGFGGTYATQENFKIMRQALDEESGKLNRYIRLTNYCSGLCMPEIAVLGAQEKLDFLLNDAMYGILFRDINMQRTLIDQHFSRLITAHAKIVIHTGEDNYLTTADAIENGHQVLASQFINECLAKQAHMTEDCMGLGHAQEMNPEHPNCFLLEIARAQMTRDIFPNSPIKFMPPTRYKSGDIFYSHLMDAMFNFVGVLTGQTIQLLGMPTEAMHTPLLQDRWMSIKNAKYIFNGARDLSQEISFQQNGVINTWAQKVLGETLKHLEMIKHKGLFKAIEDRAFAEVSRTETSGKGYDGVIKKHLQYLNPFFEIF